MADSENKNLNAESEIQTQDAPENAASENTAKKGKRSFADKKAEKLSAADKKAAKQAETEKSRAQKEWEESLVATKRVKLEEMRRTLKKVMVGLLVFALVTTSLVYVMLLFIDENNIRITASTSSDEKNISLSMDRSNWMPYLDADGPRKMIDLSYNQAYGREHITTVEEAENLLALDNINLGSYQKENYIAFGFALRNGSNESIGDVTLKYEMTMKTDDRGLENAIRIMWGERFTKRDETSVNIYAALSDNNRLSLTKSNIDRTAENGYVEKVSYPVGSDDANSVNYNLAEYETALSETETGWSDAEEDGYFDTVPFSSGNFIFQKETTLAPGEFIYIYVCVWIEGSDFDCTDDVLGGYVSMLINFTLI